jgi:hypothetical protein
MRIGRVVTAVACCLALPATLEAQQTPSSVVAFLVTNQSVATGNTARDLAAAEATSETISRALLVNLATAPIATSSSGFVYRLDPELGTMTRVSDSFGTFFVERAMTGGRGHLSLGASATRAAYDELDGINLGNGTLVTTANQFADEASPYDVDSLTLHITTKTLTVFGSYGVTNRLEVGAAVPFVQLHLDGSRVDLYRGQQFLQASGSADASGVADVAVRAKYALINTRDGAFAAAAEWRLPTGSADNLLGAGRAALRLLALGSIERSRIGVHGNAGIVRGGASDEVTFAGALTVAATSRVTLTAETRVRRFSDLFEIMSETAPHPTITGVNTLRLVPGGTATVLSNLVTGAKWNPGGALVIAGDIQWRLGRGGLTAGWIPSLSFDYLF